VVCYGAGTSRAAVRRCALLGRLHDRPQLDRRSGGCASRLAVSPGVHWERTVCALAVWPAAPFFAGGLRWPPRRISELLALMAPGNRLRADRPSRAAGVFVVLLAVPGGGLRCLNGDEAG